MTWANPWDDPNSVRRVVFDGWTVPALLVAVDGNELEQDWTVQKAKDKTGATAVWNGTKLVEGLVYTFEAESRERFLTLETLAKKLEPPPGGSTGSASGPPTSPTGFSSGSQAAGGAAASTSTATSPTGFSSGGPPTAAATAAAKGNAGAPKPPSVSIVSLFANSVGVVRVGIKKRKGPYLTKGLSWRMDVTLIQVAPSTKAAGGPASPGSASNGFSSGGNPKTAADAAGDAAKQKAQQT